MYGLIPGAEPIHTCPYGFDDEPLDKICGFYVFCNGYTVAEFRKHLWLERGVPASALVYGHQVYQSEEGKLKICDETDIVEMMEIHDVYLINFSDRPLLPGTVIS